jgi:hypothetical protein
MPALFLCTDYRRAEGPYDAGGEVANPESWNLEQRKDPETKFIRKTLRCKALYYSDQQLVTETPYAALCLAF